MSRGVTWDAKEVKALVECWADQKMQNMINNGKSNEDIFAVIANEVGRDPDCCMRKMFCLKRIYRKYKGDQAKTGGGEILPPSAISGVYDVLDEVLHEQPCSAPVLYSSLDAHCQKVVIVGAGVSGLSAARHLCLNGICDVTILEAENRIGGRLYTDEIDGVLIERGAGYIHGKGGNPIFSLMSKNYEVVDGHYDITEALFSRSSGLETNEEMKSLTAFALDGLRDLMKEKLKNQSKRGLLKHKILESETRAVWNDHIKEKSYKLGKNITDAIYNYAMIEWSLHYGQLARNISALLPFFYKELEGSDYYMPGGYSGLLEILTNDIPKCAIKLGKEVQTIHWKNETVLVDYIDGNGTKGSVTADHVIVTVSIAVLQKHHKTLFVPGLTRRKARAIEKLRLGVVNRIYLFYDQQFWTENDFRMCIFWDSNIEQEFKDDGHWFKHINMIEAYDENVLLIWANAYVSEVASSLSNESLGILLTAFIRKVMKNNTIKTPRTVFITNWQEKEHFLGSYSYTAPGQNRLTKNLAMNPLSVKGEPKVLFAGEAMHQTRFGTIDGAYLTGIREAKRILDRNFDKTQ